MKETECTLCLDKKCIEVKDKRGITRVIMSKSYPTDMSVPETSKIPISGCVFRQAQEVMDKPRTRGVGYGEQPDDSSVQITDGAQTDTEVERKQSTDLLGS
jgi:hypothetical protein